MERTTATASDEGDVVLDPFCGCGTAVHAAQRMGRRWMGIDVTHLAVGLIEYRMKEAFGLRPQVVGIPTTLESAQDLADRDPYQFEMWAATRIDGIKPNQKRGRDRGIDGRGYVWVGPDARGHPAGTRARPGGNSGYVWVGPDARGHPKYEKIIVSVKGGRRIGPAMVRDLKGTVEREKAAFGIFVCIREPTGEMRTEAAAARMYETPVGTKHPRLQIYTIGDYFAGRAPDLPKVSDVMQVPAFERTPGGRQTEL